MFACALHPRSSCTPPRGRLVCSYAACPCRCETLKSRSSSLGRPSVRHTQSYRLQVSLATLSVCHQQCPAECLIPYSVQIQSCRTGVLYRLTIAAAAMNPEVNTLPEVLQELHFTSKCMYLYEYMFTNFDCLQTNQGKENAVNDTPCHDNADKQVSVASLYSSNYSSDV